MNSSTRLVDRSGGPSHLEQPGTRPVRSVLFLDIATRTGWCEGVPGGKPFYGSFVVSKDGDASDKYLGMLRWVGQRCKAFRPNALFYEAPLARNAKTAELLMGLAANACSAARGTGVWRVEKVHPSTVKAFFLPKGAPRTGSATKYAVIDRCRELGFDPKNDDEADAIAGWHYACARVAPHVAADSTPLFGPHPTNREGF